MTYVQPTSKGSRRSCLVKDNTTPAVVTHSPKNSERACVSISLSKSNPRKDVGENCLIEKLQKTFNLMVKSKHVFLSYSYTSSKSMFETILVLMWGNGMLVHTTNKSLLHSSYSNTSITWERMHAFSILTEHKDVHIHSLLLLMMVIVSIGLMNFKKSSELLGEEN